MKKKGFTLIELLAVIVVLAVIALIATPIVTRTIENSKRGAAVESVSNMIKTAELYFITSDPKYGKINLLDENLNYSGQKPELGEVELNKDGHARIYAYVNGYCVTKEFDTELYASKMNKEECNWYATDNYETTEGTTFTLNSQTIKNYLIYGNSTQETRSGKNLLNKADFTTSFTSIYYKDETTGFKLTAGKTYTLSFNYKVNSATATLFTGVGYGTTKYSTDIIYSKQYPNQTSGRQTVTFTTPTSLADGNYLFIRFARTKTSSSASVDISSVQLEEGSSATAYEKYGATPSPEFPSEIKSTGDLLTSSNCASYGSDACNNIGKYVVQIKNSSKNILNINTSDVTLNYTNITHIENGLNIKSTGVGAPTRAIIKFDCKPNTNYVLSGKLQIVKDTTTGGNNSILINTATFAEVTIKGRAYEKNNSSEQDIHIEFNSGEYKTLYLWLYINTAGTSGTEVENKYTNLMIEEGTTSSTYESYIEPKTTNIYLTEPLRKVGDYADYIDFNNKKIVRNIKEISFNGTETLTKVDTSALKTDYIYPEMKNIADDKTAIYYISTHVPSTSELYITTYNPRDGYRTSIEFRNILQRWKVEYDVDVFKQWLAKQFTNGNPVTIDYVLATPTEETIDLPNIELLDGSSTLSINTEVSPSNVKLTTSK